MKGIKYRITYCDGIMDYVHGESYQTEVIHIPELKAEINHGTVREENDSYTEKMNEVIPTKLEEVDIDDEDVEKIKTILNTEKVKKELIKKYIGKEDEG